MNGPSCSFWAESNCWKTRPTGQRRAINSERRPAHISLSVRSVSDGLSFGYPLAFSRDSFVGIGGVGGAGEGLAVVPVSLFVGPDTGLSRLGRQSAGMDVPGALPRMEPAASRGHGSHCHGRSVPRGMEVVSPSRKVAAGQSLGREAADGVENHERVSQVAWSWSVDVDPADTKAFSSNAVSAVSVVDATGVVYWSPMELEKLWVARRPLGRGAL